MECWWRCWGHFLPSLMFYSMWKKPCRCSTFGFFFFSFCPPLCFFLEGSHLSGECGRSKRLWGPDSPLFLLGVRLPAGSLRSALTLFAVNRPGARSVPVVLGTQKMSVIFMLNIVELTCLKVCSTFSDISNVISSSHLPFSLVLFFNCLAFVGKMDAIYWVYWNPNSPVDILIVCVLLGTS